MFPYTLKSTHYDFKYNSIEGELIVSIQDTDFRIA